MRETTSDPQPTEGLIPSENVYIDSDLMVPSRHLSIYKEKGKNANNLMQELTKLMVRWPLGAISPLVLVGDCSTS